MSSQYSAPETSYHKRAKTLVLKSFMQKRTPDTDVFVASPSYEDFPYLPSDHPHHQRALGELQQNQQSQTPLSSPKKSREESRPNTSENGASKSLHKKTLSSISLKSMGKDGEKQSKSKEPKVSKPKKTKSSTNLASLLSRPKSSKALRKQAQEEAARTPKDKENCSPQLYSPPESSRPPIYAQFSSDYFTKQPLGGKFLEDEIDLYTPAEYSPDKQRDFDEGHGSQPLLRHAEAKQRPRSTYLPTSYSIQDIGRQPSKESHRYSVDIVRQDAQRLSGEKRPSFERKTTSSSITSENVQTRGRRVLAAVSGFTTKKAKEPARSESPLENKDIDKEFEAMLDRRNIPENQRGKMRGLALSMKKDFVRQDWAEQASNNHGTYSSNSSADATSGTHEIPEVKSRRSRSRTFTMSRSSSKDKDPTSPIKKSKPEGTFSRHSRTKSSESVGGENKSLVMAGASVAQNIIAKAKGQTPDDFVTYLKKNTKPELVEVGRLHKLRLLLRNETVAWTDEFVSLGGMEEIVGLLHRTMEVEWREEHEDALLHEVLLCLKALATTALALHHLNKIQVTLFPALLHMLFDEEKKGPSEFTTRNIISYLLFTWLKSAPVAERTLRAKTLLSYLRNQEASESQRPVNFVLEMRRSRPYTVWYKEASNVTKEVFWIFLHNLNVVPLPKPNSTDHRDASPSTISSCGSRSSFDSSNPFHMYMAKHFPQELPPVPAAPYVGGVEWDATNYLASHLDLINGIIASLPTQMERNSLRDQMRISGWEKVMGGTLRLCKEKFYGGVHAGLRCWVAAAAEDGWDTRDVRCGPSVESKSPRKSPAKKGSIQKAPKIDMKLSFGGDNKPSQQIVANDAWL